MNHRISREKRAAILSVLCEGPPVNALARAFKISKPTILRMIAATGARRKSGCLTSDGKRLTSRPMTIPICPHCGKRNVPLAHVLGHAGRGKPKTLTAEQRADQAARMAAVNVRRKEAKQ